MGAIWQIAPWAILKIQLSSLTLIQIQYLRGMLTSLHTAPHIKRSGSWAKSQSTFSIMD